MRIRKKIREGVIATIRRMAKMSYRKKVIFWKSLEVKKWIIFSSNCIGLELREFMAYFMSNSEHTNNLGQGDWCSNSKHWFKDIIGSKSDHVGFSRSWKGLSCFRWISWEGTVELWPGITLMWHFSGWLPLGW